MRRYVEQFLRVEREDKLMEFFNKNNFDNEMQIVKDILEEKGYVLESDHPYAYLMQYRVAFDEVDAWLEEHDYEGKLNNIGLFDVHLFRVCRRACPGKRRSVSLAAVRIQRKL